MTGCFCTSVPRIQRVRTSVGSWAGVPPAYHVGQWLCVPLPTATHGEPHPHSEPVSFPSPTLGQREGLPTWASVHIYTPLCGCAQRCLGEAQRGGGVH